MPIPSHLYPCSVHIISQYLYNVKKKHSGNQDSLAANVSYAREMRDQMEAYFSGTTVITKEYADKIKGLYDIDISNCRSYLSAKKKILNSVGEDGGCDKRETIVRF